MIQYLDIHTEDCNKLGTLKACLDFPACGYHEGNTLLIAGWVLPIDPLKNDVKVIVRVEDEDHSRDFNTKQVARPDVFKAKLPNIEFPETAMHVGFSIRLTLNNSATASIIIIKDGEQLPWYKMKVVVDDKLTLFTRILHKSTQELSNEINTNDIVSNTKLYYSHNIDQSHPSVVHAHLKKLRNAVRNEEFIVALYKSEKGHVACLKSQLSFKICSSKSLNDHVFLFCRDDSGIEFIVHQHVTSIDGVYYPKNGIFFTFCHGSQNRLVTIVELLLKENNYFTNNPIKGKAYLIGHGRPYHFMYDGMLGLETIYNHTNEIGDKDHFYTLESNAFIDGPKVYNSKQKVELINNRKLTQLEDEGTLFIKLGALFGSGAADPSIIEKIHNLDKKIMAYVRNNNSDDMHELKKHFPIIWLGVTGQKRAWLEQIEGYSNIINRLYESFPGMAVVFDGWTSSLVSIQRDKVETENDQAIISEIKKNISSDITIIDLVGATIDKKIHIGSIVDCAIVNYSTGSMNISRICGRPCITHMNNSFSPARNQHIHKNAYHISDEYVTDVMDNDSRIDATSYHIDWENIYSALILHLGKNNLIQKRW